MLRDLVENDGSLAFVSNEQLGVLHLVDQVIVLVGGLHILAEECTADAGLQDQD